MRLSATKTIAATGIVAVLAACGTSLNATQQGGTAAPAPRDVGVEVPAELSPPDLTGVSLPSYTVEDLTFQHRSSESKDAPFSTRWPTVPGAAALNHEVSTQQNTLVDEYLKVWQGNGGAYPELHSDAQLVLATPDVAGVRSISIVPAGAKSELRHRTVYGARDGSWAAPAEQLVRSDSRHRLAARAVAAAKQDSGHDVAPGSPEEVLQDLVLRPDGGALVALATAADPMVLVTGRLTAQDLEGALDDRAKNIRAVTPVTTSSLESTPQVPSSPAGSVDCTKNKCVALTFDDGPGPDTPRLLDELREQKAPATFLSSGRTWSRTPRRCGVR